MSDFYTHTDRRREDLCVCAQPERPVLPAQHRWEAAGKFLESSSAGAMLPGEKSITEETEAPILAVWEAKFKRRKERRQHRQSSGNRPDTRVVTHEQWVDADMTLEDKVLVTKFQGSGDEQVPTARQKCPWSRAKAMVTTVPLSLQFRALGHRIVVSDSHWWDVVVRKRFKFRASREQWSSKCMSVVLATERMGLL